MVQDGNHVKSATVSARQCGVRYFLASLRASWTYHPNPSNGRGHEGFGGARYRGVVADHTLERLILPFQSATYVLQLVRDVDVFLE